MFGHGDVGGERRVTRAGGEGGDDARRDPTPEDERVQAPEEANQQRQAHRAVNQQADEHHEHVGQQFPQDIPPQK